jgi:hypothetical protein
MVKQVTILKYVAFLNELQRLAKTNAIINMAALTKDFKCSTSLHLHAVRLGYFEKIDNINGLQYQCNLLTPFEPYHARKLAEEVNKYNTGRNAKSFKKENLDYNNTIKALESKKKYYNIPPTIEEVRDRIKERNISKFTAESFYAYYEANGWRVGHNKMKNWDASLSYWNASKGSGHVMNTGITSFSDDELIAELKRRGYSGDMNVNRKISF